MVNKKDDRNHIRSSVAEKEREIFLESITLRNPSQAEIGHDFRKEFEKCRNLSMCT